MNQREISIGICLALACLFGPAAAHAETFTAINGNDGGPGSFRSCINSSNKNGPGLDTIICAPGATIVLTRALTPVQGLVIIEGRGATVTTQEAVDVLPFDPAASGSTLTGLALLGGTNRLVIRADGMTVRNCRLGADWAGAGSPLPGCGILLTGAENRITGNLVANNAIGIQVDGAGATRNALVGNTVCAFTTAGILLTAGGNENLLPPLVGLAVPGWVSGTAEAAGDTIEVFIAEPRAGQGGSLASLGLVLAGDDPPFAWTLASGAGPWLGDRVCATAAREGNTSAFSENFALPTPSPSPTPTISATATISPTFTPTPSATPTPTISAIATASPERTGTVLRPDRAYAFPNPARDRMRFVFAGEEPARVEIFNCTGERVASLAAASSAGVAQADWDCGTAGAGVYLARISASGRAAAVLKVAVLR